MGTSITTNLGLIKPDGSEKIKEELPTYAGWAAQNANNMDVIDGLFRASNTTFTPTWGAATTPPTLGAGGFVEGKYLRLWPRMVIAYYRIYCGGAGFAAGSGQYSLTLPVAVPTEFNNFSDAVTVGKAILYDDSAVLTSDLLTVMWSKTGNNLFLRIPAGGTWSNTNPFTLAQQDRVSIYIMYPTSAA